MICEWTEGCLSPATMRSYCECHVWRVYQKGTKLSARRKDQRIANDVFLWQSLMDEAINELELEGEL